MKTFNKNMTITIGDGYRDNCSLLTIKANDSKDVIKDLISVLPNVLVLNVSDQDAKPIVTSDLNKQDRVAIETRNYYNCFDMYRMKEMFMNVIVIEREWVHVNEDGSLGNHISNETEYRINYNSDDQYAMSIILMIGNYYKHSKTATFRVTDTEYAPKLDQKVSTELLVYNFPDLKNHITDDDINLVIETNSERVNLDGKKLIDRVLESLRPKYTVVLPITSSSGEEETDIGLRKIFIDSYDVYSMDTTIGKLFEILFITASTIGNETGLRNDRIDEYVVLKCPKDKISTYAADLIKNTILIVNSELSNCAKD